MGAYHQTDDGPGNEHKRSDGLVEGHAYSLLHVKEFKLSSGVSCLRGSFIVSTQSIFTASTFYEYEIAIMLVHDECFSSDV